MILNYRLSETIVYGNLPWFGSRPVSATAIEKVRVNMPHNATVQKFGLVSAVIVTVSLLLVGCQAPGGAPPTAVPEETGSLVWPEPPDTPRISYVGSVSSEKRLKGARKQTSTLKDILLGRETKPEQKDVRMKVPYGVNVDRQGRIFVTDTGLNRLLVFDRAHKTVSMWGEEGNGHLRKPIGVASDSQGRVYVTDAVDKRVVVYDRTGRFLNAWNPGDVLDRPTGIAIDEKRNRVYVVDTKKHHVAILNMRGALIKTVGKRGTGLGQFNFPSNVAVDKDGNFYVVDTLNHRVQVFSPDGKHKLTFGKNGDAPGNFARPRGVSLDSDGNIYVVDAAFGNFQIFNQEGRILLFVGRGGSGRGEFQLPAGAFVDGRDRIYVVDQVNARVQIFQYLKENGGTKPAS